MKRRTFLITSGTAFLGSTAFQSVRQQSVVGLNFDLVGVEDIQPSNIDSVVVDFQNFELIPKYVDETAGDATITITLDIEGHGSKETSSTVSFTNGNIVDASDLGSSVPIVKDGINSTQDVINGSVRVSVDHPSVSDSYKKTFSITDDSLQKGLVGYWPLHEWSGRANDLSGNGNHGNLNGGITQGISSNRGLTSYSFDGSDDWVNCGDINEISTKVSVSLWYRPPEAPWGGDASNNGLVSKGVPEGFYGQTDTKGYHVGVNENRNSPIATFPQDGSDDVTMSLSSMESYQWNHITFTFDADNNEIQGYINGQLDSTLSSKTIYNMSVSESFGIGRTPNAGGGRYSKGQISSVRVYDRILNDNEVEKLYNFGLGDYTDGSLHDGSDSSAVSRWKFDGSKTDSWGVNDATNSTAGYSKDSIRGQSKVFNGTDDSLDANFGVGETAPVTISLWIKPDDVSSEQRPFGGHGSSGEYPMDIQMKDSGGQINSAVYNGTNGVVATSGTGFLSSGSWYNVVGVNTGSKLRLYINGVLIDEKSHSLDATQDSNYMIGSNQRGSEYYDGQIDDVRYYNRELNTLEVQQLYEWGSKGRDLRARTTTKNKSYLDGWWKLNETSGSKAKDSSGNGNDASVFGAGPDDTGTSDSPVYGSAYDFDGTGDYVEIPNNNVLQPSNGPRFSISTWVRHDSVQDTQLYVIRSGDSGNKDYTGLLFDSGQNSFEGYILDDSVESNYSAHIYSDTSPQVDKWYHVVFTKDWNGSNSFLKMYVNGSLESEKTDPYKLNGQSDSTSELRIGLNGYESAPMNGSISDARIYNRVLTPQEVSYLYEQKY